MKNIDIRALVLTFVIACSTSAAAQADSTHTFWDNWFVQFGADMTVQKPHGHAFKDALSKGTSFGVDVAVGKWFTREVALRGKLCWDNGIIDSNAEWLAPFDQHSFPRKATSRVNHFPTATSTPKDVPLLSASLKA